MNTTSTTPASHFEEIKNTLSKIVKAVKPDENDLPLILCSWGDKLSGAETLDALNMWLHTYLDGEKEKADQEDDMKQLNKLEPDPLPADTSDVSG